VLRPPQLRAFGLVGRHGVEQALERCPQRLELRIVHEVAPSLLDPATSGNTYGPRGLTAVGEHGEPRAPIEGIGTPHDVTEALKLLH
jgi:hypothetical protein